MDVKYQFFFTTRLLYCKKCGYEQQENFPSDKELVDIYNSTYYKTYGENNSARHQKKIYFNKVLNNINLESDSKILEVGCGTGSFLEVCNDRGFDIHGLDINEFGISEASKIIGDSKLFCTTFECFDFDEKFDAIFMFDYIEHVKNQEEVLKIAFDRLNDNGMLVLTTPSASSYSNKIMGSRWPHYIEEHLSFFSTNALELLLAQVGYVNITIKSFNKILTFNYIYNQVKGKSMNIFPLVGLINKLLPNSLKESTFSINTGDIIAIAKK